METKLDGAQEVAKERARQKRKWGKLRHDDRHKGKEIARNAADVLQSYINGPGSFDPVPGSDVWGLGLKHNKNPRRCLVVVGALIAAEIDRIDRAEKKKK